MSNVSLVATSQVLNRHTCQDIPIGYPKMCSESSKSKLMSVHLSLSTIVCVQAVGSLTKLHSLLTKYALNGLPIVALISLVLIHYRI